MKSLKDVLDILDKYSKGSLKFDEEIAECQKLLRESEVLGELENGNVYVLRYAADDKLYALGNYNTGTLSYICEYDEYVDTHKDEEIDEGI